MAYPKCLWVSFQSSHVAQESASKLAADVLHLSFIQHKVLSLISVAFSSTSPFATSPWILGAVTIASRGLPVSCIACFLKKRM